MAEIQGCMQEKVIGSSEASPLRLQQGFFEAELAIEKSQINLIRMASGLLQSLRRAG